MRQNDFTPGLVNIGRKELVKLPVRLRNARHVCQNTRHTGQRPPARAALPQDTQKIPFVSKQTAARGRLPQIDAQDAAARKAVGPVGGIYLLKAIRQKRLHLQSVNSFALSIQIEEQVDRIAAERPVKTEVDSRRRLLRTLKRVQSKIFQPVRVGKYLAFTVVVRPHIMGRLRLVIGILQPDSLYKWKQTVAGRAEIVFHKSHAGAHPIIFHRAHSHRLHIRGADAAKLHPSLSAAGERIGVALHKKPFPARAVPVFPYHL